MKDKPKEYWWKQDCWTWGKRFFAVMGLCSLLTLIVAAAFDQTGHPKYSTVWDLLGTSRDQWLVLMTAALAIATYGLFRRTATVAEQTASLAQETKALADATKKLVDGDVAQKALEDLHHRQSSAGFMACNDLTLTQRVNRYILLCGTLKNVGFGPALQVFVQVSIPENTFRQRVIGSFTAGNELVLAEGPPETLLLDFGENGLQGINILTYTVRFSWISIYEHMGFCEYEFRDGQWRMCLFRRPEDEEHDALENL